MLEPQDRVATGNGFLQQTRSQRLHGHRSNFGIGAIGNGLDVCQRKLTADDGTELQQLFGATQAVETFRKQSLKGLRDFVQIASVVTFEQSQGQLFDVQRNAFCPIRNAVHTLSLRRSPATA